MSRKVSLSDEERDCLQRLVDTGGQSMFPPATGTIFTRLLRRGLTKYVSVDTGGLALRSEYAITPAGRRALGPEPRDA